MDEAAQRTNGGMAAILKLPDERVEALCAEQKGTYPVNYNCPGQVSVAGKRQHWNGFAKRFRKPAAAPYRFAVSGGFHSPMMDSAAEKMQLELQNVAVSAPTVPLYANYTAEHYAADAAAIKENIAMQVNHPVPWQAIFEKDGGGRCHRLRRGRPWEDACRLGKKTLRGFPSIA